MAQVDQGLGEVAGVDALAADVGLATVGEVGDAQREIAVGGPFDVGRCASICGRGRALSDRFVAGGMRREVS